MEVAEPTSTGTEDSGECEILGSFGLIIQCLLGLLSFLALVVKRCFENPKRPVIVWLLDTSKQAFSSVLAHCMNMMLAVMLSQSNSADNWDWYFINISVDVVIGVPLWFIFLKLIEALAMRYEITMLNTGNYINMDYEDELLFDLEPTKQTEFADINFGIWGVQILVWGIIVIIVKVILFYFQLWFAIILETATFIWIGWLNLYPNIKLLAIMVIVPFILNSFQFWIQDNILKSKKSRTIQFRKYMRKKRNSMHAGETTQMVDFDPKTRYRTIVTRKAFNMGA